MRTIRFFDTTLRDGEQTPGVRVHASGKVEIARMLERMGADIIEAGFPASSKGDAKAVADIAAAVRGPVICGLCRATREDIDAAAEALKGAEKKRIHVFIATSDLHLQYKLKMTREEAEARAVEAVKYAASLCPDVEFSAEDAGRSDREYLFEVLAAAIKAGATTINIPDTVGYNLQKEYGRLISDAITQIPGARDVIVSAHCHNDLGMATANSLAAIEAGAGQIECTINGVGERAGNASLEEIAMTLVTRKDFYGCAINLDTTQFCRASKLVSSLYGIAVPPNKPIVGDNAFSHESGIHQHGVMCNAATYEIMQPEEVGRGGEKLVLGKLSGRHAFAAKIRELGYTINDEAVNECFARFKDYADRKAVGDDDIQALVNEYLDSQKSVYVLDTFQIQSGNKMHAMAMVTMSVGGEKVSEAAVGDGPINAAFNAVNRLSGAEKIELEQFDIKAVTEGADALGEARVRINIGGAAYTGRSVAPDIIEASIRAYVNAINKWAGSAAS